MGHEKEEGQKENQPKTNADDEEICDTPMETATSANVNDDDDDNEIEEIEEDEEIDLRPEKTFHERTLLIMEKFASYRTGQEVMKRTDRMLRVLEETAKWSVPTEPEVKLERPLPWIPFLALVILMRMARFWCSLISFATRFQPVRPQEMVYFFQTRRRTLRLVRINGLKTIRNREQQPTLACRHETVRNVDEGFLRRLRSLLSGNTCRPCAMPGVPRRDAFAPFGVKKSATEVRTELEAETAPQPGPSTTATDNADGLRKRARRYKKRKDDDKNLTMDEMLEKYGNLDSNATDSDYDPRYDEEDQRSGNYSSSAEETVKENVQAAAEAVVHNANVADVETVQNVAIVENVENMENNDNEIKENGSSKAAEERKSESGTDTDKEGEANENGSSETVQQHSDSAESNAATTEAAPRNHASTPITSTRTHLAVASRLLEEEENKQKSTPGHETAASLKPHIVTSTSTESQKSEQNKAKAEEKCYRTITTQTCLEIDWSITIKTEITHRRTRPKLENLNYSVQLTPSTSSDEDTFYSPIGSPQDFHTIFHPAPIVKGSTTEDFHFSTMHNTPTNGAT